jgi:putative membrane protein
MKGIRIGLVAAGFAGLFVATLLVAYFGLEEVGDAFLAVGGRGILAIALIHALPLALCGFAWAALLPGAFPAGALLCTWARWVRESVGSLLGILPVAGEIVGLRILALHGVRGITAGASVVVDVTAESLAQVVYTLLGLALLLLRDPDGEIWRWIAIAAGACLPPLSVLLVARNRWALRLLERIPERLAASLKLPWHENGDTLPDTVHRIFEARRGFLLGVLFHFFAWIAATVEVWLALRLMGHPVALWEALAYESLVQAIKGAIFIVPWSAGVQEGSYVLIAAAFGVTPESALALSLLKRARDIVLGVPALLAWQFLEGGRLHRRRRARSAT